MTLTEFKKLLQDRFRMIDSTFKVKQSEYANQTDVFENIKNGVGVSLFNTEPEQVAWSYAAKHLESIMSILKKLPEEKPPTDIQISVKPIAQIARRVNVFGSSLES